MPLSDAILDIAKEMEIEADGFSSTSDIAVMKGFVRSLRSAVKAAEGIQQGGISLNIPKQANPQDVLIKHAQRELEQRTLLQEKAGSSMLLIVGGDADGTMIEVDPSMPVNARMPIGSEVYIFRDGKLNYSPEETERYRKARGK